MTHQLLLQPRLKPEDSFIALLQWIGACLHGVGRPLVLLPMLLSKASGAATCDGCC